MNMPNLAPPIIRGWVGSTCQSGAVQAARPMAFRARRRPLPDYAECYPADSDRCDEFVALCEADDCGAGSVDGGEEHGEGVSCHCVDTRRRLGFRVR